MTPDDAAFVRDLLVSTGPVGTLLVILGGLVRNWVGGVGRKLDTLTRTLRATSLRHDLLRAEVAAFRGDLARVLAHCQLEPTAETEETRRLRAKLDALESVVEGGLS